jgi:hypothetical protein
MKRNNIYSQTACFLFLLAGCARNPVNIATRDAQVPSIDPFMSAAATSGSSALSGVSISPSSFSAAGKATITLTMTSRSGGIRYVALKSSSTAVKVPSSCGVWTNDSQDICNTQAVIAAVTSPQTVTITATYNGVSKTAVVTLNGGSTTPTYLLTASPAALAFGNVTVGQSSTLTETLRNAGTGAVTITGITTTNAAQFALSDATAITAIQPGASATFTATFKPAAAGVESGSIAIASNAASSPLTIALSGTGVAIAPPPAVTVSKLSCASSTPTGPTTDACTATLSSLPTSAVTVTLSSSSSAVTIPPSVTETGSATIPITAMVAAVTTAVPATLAVSLNGSTVTFPLTDEPPAPPPPAAYEVTLTWIAPASSPAPVTGYAVYRNGTLLATVTAPPYIDKTPADGVTYSYTVNSVDAAGVQSVASNSYAATIP